MPQYCSSEHGSTAWLFVFRLVMTLAAGIALFAIAPAAAQSPPAAKPEMRENCPGLVASDAPRVMPAALRLALNPDQVRITYSGHSTFLIESPQLVRIATDYNDYVRPPVLPDIATMNHAHSHALHRPSRSAHPPRAARLGPEPGPAGAPRPSGARRARAQRADQYPRLGAAAPSATATRSSSSRWRTCASPISAICIIRSRQQQLDEIGRIDVVFAPVDGTLTLDTEGMIEVLQAMKAQL